HAKDLLINESTVSSYTIEKLDRLIQVVKHVGIRLDRLDVENQHKHPSTVNRYRRKFTVFDDQYEMFRAFLNGTLMENNKDAFVSFGIARELASFAGETEVEAECLYRSASLLISQDPIDDINPRTLL